MSQQQSGVYRVMQHHNMNAILRVPASSQAQLPDNVSSDVNVIEVQMLPLRCICIDDKDIEIFTIFYDVLRLQKICGTKNNENVTKTRRRWEKQQIKIIQEYINSKLSGFDLKKEVKPKVKWTEVELQAISARVGASPNLKPKLQQELKV
jgi:hypothetical protein